MRLPYFDLLLEGRKRGERGASVFSRHVHWGYWPSLLGARLSDEAFAEAMARLDDLVVEGVRPVDGMTLADVGCGFGGTLKRLSERLPNARLLGVNFDERQLAVADAGRAALIRADACRLPLATGAFDALLAVECIFHFPSRQTFLKEAARALKPGGRLSLSDFVPLSVRTQGGAVGRYFERTISRGYGTLGAGWTEGDYAKMAAKAGLVVERERDITRGTLPTYLKLLRLSADGAFGDRPTGMAWPTVLLFLLSALGLVRYRVVSLRKPTGSKTTTG